MGAAVDYLQRTKSGRLNFRREFPHELRLHIPGSPRELKRSLGSDSIKDPIAARRFAAASEEYDAVVALARKAAVKKFDPITPLTVAYFKELVRHQSLASDEASRWDQGEREQFDSIASQIEAAGLSLITHWQTSYQRDERGWEKRSETLDIVEAAYRHHLSRGQIRKIVDLVAFEVEELAASVGLRFDQSSAEFPNLCRAYVEASLEAIDVKRQRQAGSVAPTPPEPSLQPAAPSAATHAPPREREPMSKTIERVLNRPGKEASGSTTQSVRTAMRTFIEVNGDTPLADVTRRHVSQWVDLLSQKPASLTYDEQKLPLPKLAEKYQGQNVPRLKGKTISTHLQALGAAWNKARKAGYLPEGTGRDDNPFAEHDVVVTRSTVPKGFSPEELKAIFALPVFTKGERPAQGKGEAAFWIPLLLLWTGARPEEVAQLLVSDIAKDAETGRWMITITDEGDHPEKGKRTLKTARTNSGRRTFPIPAELIRIGFIDYVEGLWAAGETAMFPYLRLKGGERKELNASWTQWWGPYLRSHSLLGEAGSGRQPAREFRHTWTTAARASELSEAAQEYIQGHSTAGKSANVGYGSREPLGREIDRIIFKGLDLSHIRWAPLGAAANSGAA